MTITVSGSAITFPDATTQTTAGKSGTVTSVATGNGLQGGTITTSGTLSVACPTFNTVGSYCFIGTQTDRYVSASISAGGNYAVGYGFLQMRSANMGPDGCGNLNINLNVEISGTWKWMGTGFNLYTGSYYTFATVGCRVS